MTIKWSFSYNFFENFHRKKCGSNNLSVLHPICVITRCYKGTVLKWLFSRFKKQKKIYMY